MFPNEADLLRTGEDSLIVIISKTPQWKNELTRLKILKFKTEDRTFTDQTFKGSVKLILENDLVYIYRWYKFEQ
jgi:hypothetical protein